MRRPPAGVRPRARRPGANPKPTARAAAAGRAGAPRRAPRRRGRAGARAEDDAGTGEDRLSPEEDWTVPGGSILSSNTELGKAVRGACDELENLAELDRENAKQTMEVLKKLGLNASLVDKMVDTDYLYEDVDELLDDE